MKLLIVKNKSSRKQSHPMQFIITAQPELSENHQQNPRSHNFTFTQDSLSQIEPFVCIPESNIPVSLESSFLISTSERAALLEFDENCNDENIEMVLFQEDQANELDNLQDDPFDLDQQITENPEFSDDDVEPIVKRSKVGRKFGEILI